MKSITNYINEKLFIKKKPHNYFPETIKELQELLKQLIKERGNEGDFNDIDTSEITDMTSLFHNCASFNGDISKWDVSNVTDMYGMFWECKSFNQPLNNWDVSNVTNMGFMFDGCTSFNQDLSKWDVSKVTNTKWMFNDCSIEEKYKPKFQ